MTTTPKGSRTHIAIFGRRNVGKSSFLNAFTNQSLSIVSDVAGTTTDPVEKAYELLPFGPVLLIDTAGMDDVGSLGDQRVAKTEQVLLQGDCAILILEPNEFLSYESDYIEKFRTRNIPFIVVINKADTVSDIQLGTFIERLRSNISVPILSCSALQKKGIEPIKEVLVQMLESLSPTPPLIADLLTPPETVVMVVPIDKEAPKGRLILPQVQTLRELLDADIAVMVVKDKELKYTLDHVLKGKPKIVITDSQVFLKVDADVPNDILLTSFSILFARQKGDLSAYVRGLKAVPLLKNHDKILISELCSHRPISEDIGRVKIPRWLTSYTGLQLDFEVAVAKDFPKDLSPYKLIIQCGGCVVNRKYCLSKIDMAEAQGIPITNYGLMIAYLHGILDRALQPFPTIHEILKEEIKS